MKIDANIEQPLKSIETASSWHIRLFEKSVLKQEKLRQLTASLPSLEEKTCLDLGADNGVIAYFLRERGGTWHSADLTQESVASIQKLVNSNVSLIDGKTLPFEDSFFDIVVIIDMLEHVDDDRRLVQELARVMKPGGKLILNVPNNKVGSPLRGIRHFIGLTDEAHGHLRPGYSKNALQTVLTPNFELRSTHTYSRFFSELIDTCIVFTYQCLSSLKGKKSEEEAISKGLVFTEEDMKSHEKTFKLYAAIYPLVKAFSLLDSLIPFFPGFMRLGVAINKGITSK